MNNETALRSRLGGVRARVARLLESGGFVAAFAAAVLAVFAAHVAHDCRRAMGLWQEDLLQEAGYRAADLADWSDRQASRNRAVAQCGQCHGASVPLTFSGRDRVAHPVMSTAMGLLDPAEGLLAICVHDGAGRLVLAPYGSAELCSSAMAQSKRVLRQGGREILTAGARPENLLFGYSDAMQSGNKARGGQLRVVTWADPNRRILPRVLKSMTNSASLEAVLAARDAVRGEAIYLSHLRRSAGPSFIRKPLRSDPALKAALEGRSGFGNYRDYRGVEVLAAAIPVRNSGLGMLVKVDRSEARKGVVLQAIPEGMAAVLLILFVLSLRGMLLKASRLRESAAAAAGLTERRRTAERLAMINERLLAASGGPEESISRLTALAGEVFAADCAFYSRLEGGLLRAVGTWRAPAGCKGEDKAEGHVCHSVIQGGQDGPVHIADLRSYFGHVVKRDAARVGALCVVHARGFEPSQEDRRLLGIIASAIGMEEGRKALSEQFLQSQKMEAVGRLAGGVAHDFNNLLTVIRGCAEFLLAGFGPGDSRLDDAREIVSASDRAAVLIRQLLAFSRKQVLSPVVLDLNSVVEGIGKMLKRLLGEDIELVLNTRSAVPRVRVDASQFEQVLVNLAVNARDAMPQGGRLTIETSAGEAGGRACVLLRVSDTGTGIAPGHLPRVFDPFFTTKAKGKGTGLGLSTVYGIIKQSGGDISVESEAGSGAIFTIGLPAWTGGADAPEREAPKAEDGKGRGETILLVEDEERVRSFAARALADKGYEVLQAGSGEEALRLLEGRQGAVHLLLTDVIMPGMNGKQLADKVAALRPGVGVLFVSGYTDDALGRSGALDADVNLVLKPFTANGLCLNARRALDAAGVKPGLSGA